MIWRPYIMVTTSTSIAMQLVHYIVEGLTDEVATQVFFEYHRRALVILRRETSGMRTDEDIIEVPQRMVWRQRFLVKNVKRSSGNPFFPQSENEVRFITNVTPSNVYQESCRFHGPKSCLVENTSCARGQRHRNDHNIAFIQHKMQLFRRVIALWQRSLGITYTSELKTVIPMIIPPLHSQHMHAKDFRQSRYLPPNTTISYNCHCFSP